MYRLSQNYCIAAPYSWTISFGHRNVKIASQKLSWNYFLGAVILAGDLNGFRSVIAELMSIWCHNDCFASQKFKSPVIVSGQIGIDTDWARLSRIIFWECLLCLKVLDSFVCGVLILLESADEDKIWGRATEGRGGVWEGSLSFLSLFWGILLVFSLRGSSLLVWVFFISFCKVFGVFGMDKNSLFFVWFSLLFAPPPPKKRKGMGRSYVILATSKPQTQFGVANKEF